MSVSRMCLSVKWGLEAYINFDKRSVTSDAFSLYQGLHLIVPRYMSSSWYWVVRMLLFHLIALHSANLPWQNLQLHRPFPQSRGWRTKVLIISLQLLNSERVKIILSRVRIQPFRYLWFILKWTLLHCKIHLRWRRITGKAFGFVRLFSWIIAACMMYSVCGFFYQAPSTSVSHSCVTTINFPIP